MTRRMVLMLVVAALVAASCGNLGLGQPDCISRGQDVSTATVMTVQAVPSARYTPCLNEVRLEWDAINWSAETGRAGFDLLRRDRVFLSAEVRPACDPSGVEVDSGFDDIRRFEDVQFQQTNIGITIIPSGERPQIRARLLVEDLAGVEIDDRPVVFTIDDNMDQTVGNRVNLALLRDQYVWIIDELDAEEGTVELRSDVVGVAGSGLDPDDALDVIEDFVPEVFYRGTWYFTFEGGCITYAFDARGALAETVADDADDALGFFPAYELIQAARDAGYDIGE
ncbi:MAG: hypothetical protein QNJ88_04650 [Acidimicrobiia bacterium]|nr:hypothetical protein [Acidimicrobiia bacterium]